MVTTKFGPGPHKPVVIQGYARVREPSRVEIGADEKEQMSYRATGFLAGAFIAPAYPLQLFVAAGDARHDRAREQRNVRRGLNAFDEIARHAFSKVCAAPAVITPGRVQPGTGHDCS